MKNEEELKLLKWYFEMGVQDIRLIDNENHYIQDKKKMTENLVFGEVKAQDIAYNLARNCSNIKQLREVVINFDGCILKKTAINTVFGEGVIDSKIMLMGEAPGAKEDEAGRPFCGESGKLLDLMLKSINLDRKKNCYITNSIFWRPPGNRKPSTEEILICRPFVEKHIELFNPEFLILVGATAVESVLQMKLPMSQMRKKVFSFKSQGVKEIKTVAIFHPAYLLRQPLQKREMWSDLLFIQNLISGNI